MKQWFPSLPLQFIFMELVIHLPFHKNKNKKIKKKKKKDIFGHYLSFFIESVVLWTSVESACTASSSWLSQYANGVWFFIFVGYNLRTRKRTVKNQKNTRKKLIIKFLCSKVSFSSLDIYLFTFHMLCIYLYVHIYIECVLVNFIVVSI